VKRLTRSVAREFLAEAGAFSRDRSPIRPCWLISLGTAFRRSRTTAASVADEDGSIRREETAHYDPAKQAPFARSSNHEYRVDGPGVVPETMRSPGACRSATRWRLDSRGSAAEARPADRHQANVVHVRPVDRAGGPSGPCFR
jgi:hypothetical protein